MVQHQAFLVVECFCLCVMVCAAETMYSDCPKNTTTFIKTIGSVPSPTTPLQLLHEDDPPHPVTLTCLEKCLHLNDCAGFVLHYDTSSCYWYTKPESKLEVQVNQVDTAWFAKICSKAVENCGRLWALERVPGAILVDKGKKTLTNKVNRDECERYCLTENNFECRSANFQIDDESKNDFGICTLNTNDRHFLPNSYRVSSFYDEYYENQCTNVTKSDFCSYEEYENATLRHVDEIFASKTKDECQSLCDNNVQYHCRGYSLLPSTVTGVYTCYLHSEDTKLHGPKVLAAKSFAKYFEKARCLNITVSCTDMYMTVKYKPEFNFFGRLYMQGYSENLECYAKGLGKEEIVLKLPVFRNQCGITQARSDYNRTLMSGVLIIQYNQLIQTQGDRLIRVGCIFGNQTKILVGAGVQISSSRPNIGSTIINSSNIVPVVEMRVVDYQTQTVAPDTQIGQELQMIIEIKPPDGPYDIWAGHLVAMTEKGEESIFLLDDRGCPTNLNIFPAFTKVRNNETNRLVANFQAFKFSVSPVVRFSVIVQFCPRVCPVVDCRRVKRLVPGGERRKRLFSDGLPAKVEELPLEFAMVVRNPRINSDRFVYGDGKVLLAGYDLVTNEVCIDYSLLVGLILTWILIEVITLISCIMLVRRYKKYYEQELVRNSSDELHRNFGFGISNLDNRRVHWADNGSEFT